jgi:hypothetical protein
MCVGIVSGASHQYIEIGESPKQKDSGQGLGASVGGRDGGWIILSIKAAVSMETSVRNRWLEPL